MTETTTETTVETETTTETTDLVLAAQMAAALAESNIALLRKVIGVIGQDRAAAFLAQALAIEAAGGQLTADGSRRRSPGGVYFYLVRHGIPSRERRQLWVDATLDEYRKTRQAQRKTDAQPKRQPAPPFTWADALELMPQFKQLEKGEGKTVKITLVGRPGKIAKQADCVVLTMAGKPPGSFPKGIPAPPADSSILWIVFIANKQWDRVSESLTKNKDDMLILDGYPIINGKSGQPVVLVTGCKSMLQEKAAAEAKRAAGGGGSPNSTKVR